MNEALRVVDVVAVPIADEDSASVVRAIARPEKRTRLVYALHVAGLASMQSAEYVAAMNDADVVYADGVSVVFLARLAGARHVTRSATTDIGTRVISRMSEELGRDVRVALIGGRPGVAERAGQAIEQSTPSTIVLATDGYRADDDVLVRELNDSLPDLVFVGKGMPLEALWTHRLKDRLPPCAIVTCGGWFGFINGDEPRAPHWIIRLNLEWFHRLLLDPGRLLRRYTRGLVDTLLAIPVQAAKRSSRVVDSA